MEPCFLRRVANFVMAGVTLVLAGSMASAAPETVWQIGQFDESSHEFNLGYDPTSGEPTKRPIDYTNPGEDPVYVVGKSDPSKDWLAYQPGNSNGKAGSRAHPFTILFELPQRPGGLYTLRVALLDYSPRLPWLEVSLNGHPAWFYQHPKLNYAAGDIGDLFIPHYSSSTITVELPTRFLQAGRNRLVLTALDDPRERDDSRGAVAVVGNSGITYDALALYRDPASKYSSAKLGAEVRPTIFYKSTTGGLTEQVDVFVTFAERPRHAQVDLTVGEQKFTQRMEVDRDFGEQKLEFDVPEFAITRKASLILRSDGRVRRLTQDLAPGKKWNVFVVPHEHLDIGYTDYPPKVAEIQSRVLDEAMDMIQRHPDFRFTVDGYWCIEQFLAGRSKKQSADLLELIRQGKILVPAQYASILSGLPSLENLIRSFYPSFRFSRETGTGFDNAFLTDVPSHSWSYASVMAEAGLKFLLLPSNNMFGPMLVLGHLHENSPFWWEGPDGRRILTWYSRHYHQAASMFGLPPQVAAVRDSLPTFLQIYTRPDYLSDGVIVFGTQWENTDLYRQQAALAEEWNGTYAFPRLRFSGVSEALSYIVHQMGEKIPVVRGDGGPYWDSFMAGEPFYTALARENEQRALSAEKFSTVSSLLNPRLWPDRWALSDLWRNLLLFDEHTWDGGGNDPNSLLRLRLSKAGVAEESGRLLEQVLMRSMVGIAEEIHQPAGTLILFNPLNWQRNGLLTYDLIEGQDLVDIGTNQAVPHQVLETQPGFRRIRFLAAGIPPVGFKCYRITTRNSQPQAPPISTSTTVESPYYRLILDPERGAVRSIFDKELNRELVDASSPYRFNQYVSVTGPQSFGNLIGLSTRIAPPPKQDIEGTSGGRLLSVTQTAFGTTVRLESSASSAAHIATEIILLDGEKKIEFINSVAGIKAHGPQDDYFAFPFAMESPQFSYETQNGFVNPAHDLLPGAGREWFSAQHWVAVEQEGEAAAIVPVDAPLVTLGDVIRRTWPTEFGKRRGTIFSYVVRDPGEGSSEKPLRFRYVLTSGPVLSPAHLSRLGWEAMTPVEVNEITPDDKVDNPPRPLESPSGSFLQMDNPNVVLVTWKRAEDNHGTILRFLEVGGQSGAVKVTTPLLNVDAAWRCNAMEENQDSLPVLPHGFTFAVAPFRIVTVRVEGSPGMKSEEP